MKNNICVTDNITLGEIRGLMQMTQPEFAKYLNIPITTYRRYEKDITSARFGEAIKISDKLGIDIRYLRK